MAGEIRTASTSCSSSSWCIPDIKPNLEPLLNAMQDGIPVASTSTQFPPERANTVKNEVEHTTVNPGCSSSKIVYNGSNVSEQRERNGGTTSTQLHHEVEIILMEEIEESDVEMENTEVERSPAQMMDVVCSTSATGQQSKRKLMSAKGRKSAQPESSKKVPKPHEKYFEGCLVMGRIEKDYPAWPGMIRKPGADSTKISDYICKMGGKLRLFVQFFSDRTFARWQIPGDLRVFNAAKPNCCIKTGANIVISFEKGMRIARAASKFSVEARLAKFTSLNGAAIDNFLAEIGNEDFHTTTNAETQPPLPPLLQNNSLVLDTNATASTTQENVVSGPDLVSQHQEESAAPTDDNGESCHVSVEMMMNSRILEYQQKLRDECNREKNEEIERLTTHKEKLETSVKQQAKMIADLQETMEKVKQEKIKYKQELATMKAVFEKLVSRMTNLQ